MKCAKIDCGKMAEIGEKYCCRSHAPYGNLGVATSRERRIKESTTQENGERLRKQYDGKRIFGMLPISAKPISSAGTTHKARKNEMQITGLGSNEARETGNGRTLCSANGTEETVPRIAGEYKRENTGGIQPGDLVPQSLSVEEDGLVLPSLIDESNKLLMELMRSSVRQSQTAEGNIRMDAQKINSICNLAKNLNQNMRVKIELLRELRKK